MRFSPYPGGAAVDESVSERGMSLVEALVSLLLLTGVLLTFAQLIGTGVLVNRVSSDVTTITALAEARTEALRSMDYAAIPVGGSLTSDASGFFNLVDVDGDGATDYSVRWQVTDSGSGKMIRVRVASTLQVIGPSKEGTLSLMVAQQ